MFTLQIGRCHVILVQKNRFLNQTPFMLSWEHKREGMESILKLENLMAKEIGLGILILLTMEGLKTIPAPINMNTTQIRLAALLKEI